MTPAVVAILAIILTAAYSGAGAPAGARAQPAASGVRSAGVRSLDGPVPLAASVRRPAQLMSTGGRLLTPSRTDDSWHGRLARVGRASSPIALVGVAQGSHLRNEGVRSQVRRPAPPAASRTRWWFTTAVTTKAPDPAAPGKRADTVAPPVRLASKSFTESVILADMATQLLQAANLPATHQRALGGTRLLWDALLANQIDAYPEYTGTIAKEILAPDNLHTDQEIRAALAARGVIMTQPLGFNDTYALGMRQDTAQRLIITTISDLRSHPALRLAFSNEFMDRSDGWPALRRAYDLPQQTVRGMEHELAYRALQAGAIDATDLYSTDAEIDAGGLRILRDNRGVFPEYNAVFLCRADLAARSPQALAALRRLEGRITAAQMRHMNALAKFQHIPEPQIAAAFLAQTLSITPRPGTDSAWDQILIRTREHLFLTGLSLLAAIAAALPLGILAARHARLGQIILAIVAGIYTIPSLALLVFMIPLLGIGATPAITALFLYSLLPIVRNTQSGLTNIPSPLRESAEALGLPPMARLLRVELPLASPAILAGVKTAAVLNIGTATLGALIGAGGYGQSILTGIRLNNVSLILQGAIPAAALALVVQGAFEAAERLLVPRGLRAGAAPQTP